MQRRNSANGKPCRMDQGSHIVVVDDCVPLSETIALYLRDQGYRVSLAADGQALRTIMNKDVADLVIIDLGLPDEDGFSLTRYLREHHRCGIIMLTGNADSMNRVIGLEVGADDYITKPHESRELLARVRSVLRRVNNNARPSEPTQAETGEVVGFADWQFDIQARHLRGKRGNIVELTTGEFNLLREFVSQSGRVLSREHLLQVVHNRSWDYFDRSIDVLVTRLRSKVECSKSKSNKAETAIIKTVRGAGYVFTATVSK